MKRTHQKSCTSFLEKYGGISIYDIDMKERDKIDQ